MSKDESDKPRKRPIQEMLRQGMESARQLIQPSAFRIAAPKASEQMATEHKPGGATTGSAEDQLHVVLKTMAAVATAVWRAKIKLDAEADVVLPDELRNLPRHIQSAWDALEAGKVQIDDPTGRRYVPGMAVNTLTIQPIDGIACEIIHETIKPFVYFSDELIQRADVIVARPTSEADQNAVDNDTTKEADSGGYDAPEQKGMNTDGSDND